MCPSLTARLRGLSYPGLVPKRFANPLPWFNLERDSAESTDEAAAHPEIVECDSDGVTP